MTLDEFRQTLAAASAPPLPPLLRALWHDAKGDWDEAHRIAQDVSGADGARVHAYLHRKEGDPLTMRAIGTARRASNQPPARSMMSGRELFESC